MQYSSKILKQTAEALESLEIKFTYKFFSGCLVLEDQPIAIIDSENPLGSCMDEEVLVAFSNGKIAPLPSSSSCSLSSEESDKTVYFVHCKDCNRHFVQTAKSIHEFTCPHCKKQTSFDVDIFDEETESVECPHCHEKIMQHRVCPNCGYYDGKQDVAKKEA